VVNIRKKIIMVIGITTAAIVLFIAFEALYITLSGTSVSIPEIPRGAQTIGKGDEIKYAVMGDSTAVGQGGDYSQGIAVQTAEHLAKGKRVVYQNFAKSGAKIADVLNEQLEAASAFDPDIVLISAGANDVTHFTSVDAATKDMRTIIEKLKSDNGNVKIVITGSPQMGSVPRFPQPARYLARLKTESLNAALFDLAKEKKVSVAPIAEKTGALFSDNPQLFAQDNFHPNNRGYATWVPVLNDALTD
jgi:lysophospholipase L1-like esterase